MKLRESDEKTVQYHSARIELYLRLDPRLRLCSGGKSGDGAMAANKDQKKKPKKVGQELEKAAALITNDDFDASKLPKTR